MCDLLIFLAGFLGDVCLCHLHLHNQDSWFEHTVFLRVSALTWSFLLLSDSLSFSYHIIFPHSPHPPRPVFPLLPPLRLHISPSSPPSLSPKTEAIWRESRPSGWTRQVCYMPSRIGSKTQSETNSLTSWLVPPVQICVQIVMHQVIEKISVDSWPGS